MILRRRWDVTREKFTLLEYSSFLVLCTLVCHGTVLYHGTSHMKVPLCDCGTNNDAAHGARRRRLLAPVAETRAAANAANSFLTHGARDIARWPEHCRSRGHAHRVAVCGGADGGCDGGDTLELEHPPGGRTCAAQEAVGRRRQVGRARLLRRRGGLLEPRGLPPPPRPLLCMLVGIGAAAAAEPHVLRGAALLRRHRRLGRRRVRAAVGEPAQPVAQARA